MDNGDGICVESCGFGELPLVRNDHCENETNNEACSFDGGDCCLLNANKGHCPSNGVIISHHGTHLFSSPVSSQEGQNYGPNLDISWLIQVPSGQYVQINFIHFEVQEGGDCVDYMDIGFIPDEDLMCR